MSDNNPLEEVVRNLLGNRTNESNDSVPDDLTTSAEAVLESLLDAVEDGLVLEIQGHEYLPADAVKDLTDDNRRLRHLLKQAHRSVGKQGQTIHTLRAEIAEVRQLNSRAERGDIRRLDRDVSRLNVLLASAREEIAALNEKLSEQGNLDDVYTGPLEGATSDE